MDHRIISLTVLILMMVLMAGCTSQNGTAVSEKKTPDQTSTQTPDAEKTPVMTPTTDTDAEVLTGGEGTDMLEGMQTGSHETMALNDTINIYLKENPTTGYMWNATVSAGLRVENDTYVADPVKPGVAGSGGMHYWLVQGVEKGNQTFDAVYMRSWEPLTGNETRFTMDITVV